MKDADYARIVRDWRKPVFSLLARITGQPAAVEQLAQQTFADAFSQIPNASDPDLRLTLFRIAARRGIEFLRRSPATSFPALDALPPEQRALVVLSDVERLPLHDIGRILDISPGIAAQRLLHLRRALALAAPSGRHAA